MWKNGSKLWIWGIQIVFSTDSGTSILNKDHFYTMVIFLGCFTNQLHTGDISVFIIILY